MLVTTNEVFCAAVNDDMSLSTLMSGSSSDALFAAALMDYSKAVAIFRAERPTTILWSNRMFVDDVGHSFGALPQSVQAFVNEAMLKPVGQSHRALVPSWVSHVSTWSLSGTRFGNEQGDFLFLVAEDYTYIHQLEQMRTDFVSNVSHELRTPLTVMLGYLENFLEMDIDDQLKRGMVRMQEQAVRMNALVNDLLLLSRLESLDEPEFVQIDMPRLLVQIFDEVQLHNTAMHVIDLHLDSADNVMGLWVYLHSAILNLVINAIKYTPDDGEITIGWERVGDGCVLSVSDNGVGIAQSHLDRLTERFYRVDTGRSRQTGGTGLGLAIVKHVAQKHNAKLTIESTEGLGSTFKIFFDKSSIIAMD